MNLGLFNHELHKISNQKWKPGQLVFIPKESMVPLYSFYQLIG